MKLYSLYSLILLQAVSLNAASDRVANGFLRNHSGFWEYQSDISSARRASFVLDSKFTTEKSGLVRAIALISASKTKEETLVQLQPFLDEQAAALLIGLQAELKERQTSTCIKSHTSLSEKAKSSLNGVESLMVRFEFASVVDSAAHACYDPEESFHAVSVGYELHDWHAGFTLINSKPKLPIGSISQEFTALSATGVKDREPDLHMLIFHRNPKLIQDGE